MSRLNAELEPKRLELLRELVPKATVIAVLVNPRNPTTESKTKDVQAAARSLGRQIQVVNASTEREIDAAFATMGQLRAGALRRRHRCVLQSPRREQLAALAVRHALPAIYAFASSPRPAA